MRWETLFIIAGALTIGLTLRFGVPILFGLPILAIVGVAWVFGGTYKLAARLVVPKRWVRTEMDFMMLTSLEWMTRAALWGFFVASLILGHWTTALACGVAVSWITLNRAVVWIVARRIATRRMQKEGGAQASS
jgi:hypothetical protein